jgi:hypothetical protein
VEVVLGHLALLQYAPQRSGFELAMQWNRATSFRISHHHVTSALPGLNEAQFLERPNALATANSR